MTPRIAAGIAALLSVLAGVSATAQSGTADGSDAASRAARWQQLEAALFAGKHLEEAGPAVRIDAPPRALDAALVPVTVQVRPDVKVRGLYLVIDSNPAPLAAHVSFGPAADPHVFRLRVRVDQYTDMHAVAETPDGRMLVAARFVKAAGGCSAPAGSDDAQALADVGRMKLQLRSSVASGRPVQAQLMVRHPNFNGMQMNQITRFYTPARFIRSIDVAWNGAGGEGTPVFHMDADISLSTDPVIGFTLVPGADHGQLRVLVKDTSNASFEHSFEVPAG